MSALSPQRNGISSLCFPSNRHPTTIRLRPIRVDIHILTISHQPTTSHFSDSFQPNLEAYSLKINLLILMTSPIINKLKLPIRRNLSRSHRPRMHRTSLRTSYKHDCTTSFDEIAQFGQLFGETRLSAGFGGVLVCHCS